VTEESRNEETSLAVEDLDRAIRDFTAQGFRLEMIVPADEPRAAIVSSGGKRLRLELAGGVAADVQRKGEGLLVTREVDEWHCGRAGMEYRDLIPGRLGGACVASHIRILDGGETPDYVHYHKVNFQMIFCRTGWAQLVYEDQGPPFVFGEGDCVLQPPTIRHRVLETSKGFEVIEVCSPAVHETWVDHDLELPMSHGVAGKLYGEQPFVLTRARDAKWLRTENGAVVRDTGIEAATGGLASARVVRCEPGASHYLGLSERPQLLFVMRGEVEVGSYDQAGVGLRAGDSAVIPAGSGASVSAVMQVELLQIGLPGVRP
jgi:quercetin dioxygenase-like cupin family protein